MYIVVIKGVYMDYIKHREIIKYYSNNILRGKKKGEFRVELYLDKREKVKSLL